MCTYLYGRFIYTEMCRKHVGWWAKVYFPSSSLSGLCATADGDDDEAGVLSVVSTPRMPSFHISIIPKHFAALLVSPSLPQPAV